MPALGHQIFQKNDSNQKELFDEKITKLKDDLLRRAKEEKDLAIKEVERNAAESLRKAMEEAEAHQVC